MKKTIAIMLALMMLLSLAACGVDNKTEMAGVTVIGGQDGPEVTVTATPTQTPEPTPAPEVTPESTTEPTAEATPEPVERPVPQNDLKTTAESLIGAAVEELIAAIGEPESSDYAPSCIGPGEDGNLYYEGFIVYTYREDGTETVEYVE